MLLWLPFLLLSASASYEAEAKVVEYLKANVRPGQRVVVSELYNQVFTAAAERAALERLFNTFFKIPLFAAQQQRASGRPPTLAEIGEQFSFTVPGETRVMLDIMESDPRMPKFLERDPQSGEIRKVDVDVILGHPRFGKALERTISGFEGRPAPAFHSTDLADRPFDSASLAGKPHLVYFWFTGCPPCLKTTPLLVELSQAHGPKGFEIVAVNADRLLELPYGDAERRTYVEKAGVRFNVVHATAELQEAYGGVSVFPTLFFVDRKGTVVKQLVNFHDKPELEAAVHLALE
jgi:thiol-disulfide isomerase/thioredoxin